MLYLLKATFAALAVVMMAQPAMTEDYPKLNMKLATHLAKDHYLGEAEKFFVEEIERRSGGNIKIKIFWQRQLGGPKEVYSLVKDGSVEMGHIITGYFPSDFPFAGMTNSTPMVFSNGSNVVDVTKELWENNPLAAEELNRNNLVPLLVRNIANYHLICTRELKTVEDFKGTKIRSYGAYIPRIFDSLGAIGVNLAPPEIYESLSRGVMDCAYLNYGTFDHMKWYEVAPYISDVDFGVINAFTLMINKGVWEGLPENVQALFREVQAEAEALALENEIVQADKALKNMQENGATLIRFKEQEKLEETVPDTIDVWASLMKDRGLGDEAQEMAGFLRERRNELEN